MDGASAGSESAGCKAHGIRGGPRRGTVVEAGGGIEVPTLLWEAQSGSSRQGNMQGVGAEGGRGGMPRRGWLMRWAAALRQSCAIGALSHCGQPPAPSPGQLCHLGTLWPCRCRGWRCRSQRRAASPLQEHTDLLSVSPRQAQRHPPGCSRHHWGLQHHHPGRISPLRTGGTILGHSLEPGVFYQCPLPVPETGQCSLTVSP